MISALLLLLLVFVVVISAAPLSSTGDVERHDSQVVVVDQVNNHAVDQFDWSYKLSDGQFVRQSGALKDLPGGKAVLVIDGSYSFVAPDGSEYVVNYTADENGFHPSVIRTPENVVNLPLPPPLGINPSILASLVG